MKETKFSDEQIVKILREAERGEQTIAAVCRTHSVHETTFYKWRKRFGEQSFQRKLKDYQMLGRIWDMYINVKYEPQEVSELRDECLRVKSSAMNNQVALRGLNKLLMACDEATKLEVGIELVSD